MMTLWSWLADGILAMLLVGTLAMAIRLDRALKVVRCDRSAFEALIANLGSATSSVKLGIQALRNEADRSAELIGRRSPGRGQDGDRPVLPDRRCWQSQYEA